MTAPHHRKIELQSPADLLYLHTNAVALSRRKLDLHLPPSATNDGNEPDPMRERVKELVDEFITKTFTTATPSISINGMDSTTALPIQQNPNSTSPSIILSAPETIEYEPYDARLAARVTSLYAQLESLTTTVAQLRRDTPARAAREYGDQLKKALLEDDQEEEEQEVAVNGGGEMDWDLHIPLGTEEEAQRWKDGEVAQVYEDALRTLLRLQGEEEIEEMGDGPDGDGALATTVGKAERAIKAAEVVEGMK
ncbi:hypothetical protein MPDQ_005666 [Monascus purpureus]|uniref:Kinetochore protein mis14 n=1 Tax=Monascus purpureus TaxID=5098 RepID=A0A507QWC9_MONPU|nr:hypothetical protein MPDQ_005666 [Monascus purpureus]BDD56812.1 hypothetical protein MAP00_002232 [Monascus purpureus]